MSARKAPDKTCGTKEKCRWHTFLPCKRKARERSRSTWNSRPKGLDQKRRRDPGSKDVSRMYNAPRDGVLRKESMASAPGTPSNPGNSINYVGSLRHRTGGNKEKAVGIKQGNSFRGVMGYAEAKGSATGDARGIHGARQLRDTGLDSRDARFDSYFLWLADTKYRQSGPRKGKCYDLLSSPLVSPSPSSVFAVRSVLRLCSSLCRVCAARSAALLRICAHRSFGDTE